MLGEDEGRQSSGRGSRSFKVPARLDDVLAKVLDGIEPRPQPDAPELPERYVLIDEIGRGAQSHVYAVFDREMNCKRKIPKNHGLCAIRIPTVYRRPRPRPSRA